MPTVSSDSEFRDALSSASSGDVITVTTGTVINGDDRFIIPSGVVVEAESTLGATIEINDTLMDEDCPTLEDDAALIGFVVESPWVDGGPPHGGEAGNEPPFSDYFEEYDGGSTPPQTTGILMAGDDSEIGYCEFIAFGRRAIQVWGDRCHIHHNHIHDCAGNGYGYGVGLDGEGGDPQDILIEYNRFDRNRHDVVCYSPMTYTVQYNWCGDWLSDTPGPQRFDTHSQGDYIDCINNTFAHDRGGGECLRIEGSGPTDVEFSNNWVQNHDDCGCPNDGHGAECDVTCGDECDGSVDFNCSNNHYGTDDPPSGVGVRFEMTGPTGGGGLEDFELVDIWSTAGTSSSGPYDVSVTVDGEIMFGPEAEPGDDDDVGDVIEDNEDGTMTFTSHSLGNRGSDGGPADNYYIRGNVTDMSVSNGGSPSEIMFEDEDGNRFDGSEIVGMTFGEVENMPPEPDFTFSPSDPFVDEAVTFDAGSSSDPDGSIESYEWDIDGTSRSGEVVTHTFTSDGDYSVTLTITDDGGLDQSTTKSVPVGEAPNEDPRAAFSVAPSNPFVGERVTFDGTDSSDPDGSIESYDWDIDGRPKTGEVVTHRFESEGDKMVSLTVEDNEGSTHSVEQTVTVSEESGSDTGILAVIGILALGVGMALSDRDKK